MGEFHFIFFYFAGRYILFHGILKLLLLRKGISQIIHGYRRLGISFQGLPVVLLCINKYAIIKQKDQKQDEKKDQQQPPKSEKKQDNQMSKENAEQLLNSVMQDEKDVQDKVRKQQKVMQGGRLEKDW